MKHLIFFSCLLFFWACKTYTIDELPEEHLIFGKGGGFTGAVETHTLLRNGQLFQHNSLKKDTLTLPKIKRKQVKSCYEKANSIDWEKMAMNHPGNRYYFLEYVKGGTKNRIVWGGEETAVAEEVKLLYQDLIALVQKEETAVKD